MKVNLPQGLFIPVSPLLGDNLVAISEADLVWLLYLVLSVCPVSLCRMTLPVWVISFTICT